MLTFLKYPLSLLGVANPAMWQKIQNMQVVGETLAVGQFCSVYGVGVCCFISGQDRGGCKLHSGFVCCFATWALLLIHKCPKQSAAGSLINKQPYPFAVCLGLTLLTGCPFVWQTWVQIVSFFFLLKCFKD